MIPALENSPKKKLASGYPDHAFNLDTHTHMLKLNFKFNKLKTHLLNVTHHCQSVTETFFFLKEKDLTYMLFK